MPAIRSSAPATLAHFIYARSTRRLFVRVSVLAFARLREVFGFAQRQVDIAAGTTLEALWSQLAHDVPDAAALRPSTRFARNGALADGSVPLHDGDEVAFMPPVGGG